MLCKFESYGKTSLLSFTKITLVSSFKVKSFLELIVLSKYHNLPHNLYWHHTGKGYIENSQNLLKLMKNKFHLVATSSWKHIRKKIIFLKKRKKYIIFFSRVELFQHTLWLYVSYTQDVAWWGPTLKIDQNSWAGPNIEKNIILHNFLSYIKSITYV